MFASLARPPAPIRGAVLTGDQIVHIIEVLPATLMAAASLINSIKARRESAVAADQAREAAQEQIRFALRDAARRRSPGGSAAAVAAAPLDPIPFAMPREEGGSDDR